MKKILTNIKELLMEPYYVPLMIVCVFLGYQAWNGHPSPLYTPFLIVGVIIYIPFFITFCGLDRLISEYFDIKQSMSSIISCSDLTEPKLPLLLLILAIEYTIFYIVISRTIRSMRDIE